MDPFDCPSCVVYMLEVTQTVSSELSWLTPVLLLLLLPLSVTCSVYATVHAKDKQYDLRLFEPANNLWRSVLYHATAIKLMQRTLFIGVCVF